MWIIQSYHEGTRGKDKNKNEEQYPLFKLLTLMTGQETEHEKLPEIIKVQL